jgi:hypothetical protein
MKNLLILYLALIPLQFMGQEIKLAFNSGILVQQSGQNLSNPFAGGMNATQFESIDLTNDGLEDLVLFDRTIEKLAVFVNRASTFVYDPVISQQLPHFDSWMRFVDYDGDGKKDLFCAAPAGIQVYRNQSNGSNISFSSIANPLYSEGFSGKINLYVSSVDIPAIADMDGDGDVDILAFDPSGHYVEFHQNQSKLSGKVLDFKKLGDCWGDFVVRSCGDILLGTPCSADIALESVQQPNRTYHAGNTLNVFLHDGVPDLIYGHIGCPDLVYLTNNGTIGSPRFSQIQVGFPKSLNLGTFLHASFVDVTGDRQTELIATLSTSDNNGYMQNFQRSNVVFKQVNGKWEEFKIAFLQDQMIDVGEKASPSFWDADQDGDLDLLVANAGIREGNDVKASISYYENQVGKYVYITNDYLKLKDRLAATNLHLQTADYDADGTSDLIISGQTGQGPRVYALFKSGLQAVNLPDLAFGEVPVYLDWNQDSQMDVLILDKAGKIRTQGILDWGQLSKLKDWRLRSFSMADMDGDGTLEFVGADQDGRLHIGNYTPSTNEIIWKIQDFSQVSLGRNAQILCADFNSDGKKDVLIGTGAGGVLLLENQTTSPVWENLADELCQVWPNPTPDYCFLQTKESGIVSVFDLLGQRIDTRNVIAGEVIRLGIKGHGNYVIIFQSRDGKVSTKKLVVN